MFRGLGRFARLRVAASAGVVLAASHFAVAAGPITKQGLPSLYLAVSDPAPRLNTEIDPPQILSIADVDLYRRLFSIQESGQWRKADSLIKQLDNPILLGHVLAQRYLHPTKYRSKYRELKEWLALYTDHPQASRLYKLALRRKPGNWKRPKAPTRISVRARSKSSGVNRKLRIPSKRLSPSGRSKVRHYKRYIRQALRRGHTLIAKRALQSKELQNLFSTTELDEARAKLGQAYFSAGRDEWAMKWSGAASARSGEYVAQASWTAGLASWRLGKRAIAAGYFAKAAESSGDDVWFHAGAAFWAARAYLLTQQPELVNKFLKSAAQHKRTFYGLLAARVLGQNGSFSWNLPEDDTDALTRLARKPSGQRALALLQAGRVNLAEAELRRLAKGADKQLANGILALAAHGNLASLAVRLDQQLHPDGGSYDGAAYPVPAWAPTDGFRIDRALIYALIRQESKFNPKAKSWAGARGLMQLMPGTASFVARDRGYRWGKRAKLYTPEHNIDLGQRYIEILLNDKKINGDLFLLAAAWNGGPGNLNKWRRKNSYKNDPLFFIESIPSRETRIFIERVLANLWIYRDRFQQPAPSLDAIAQGDWPVYMALGNELQEVAEIHGTRK